MFKIGFAELVRQNSYPIHILAAEMLIEHGPDYPSESGRHAEMIKRYTDHMGQRQYATILRVLYPEYSPMKAWESASSDLEKAAQGKEEEAKRFGSLVFMNFFRA